jgi:hypothetical protein
MGCCLFTILIAAGPRLAFVLWWLVQPGRFSLAFNSSWLWPVLGVVFLPWTALMWVIVAPTGSLNGFAWIWIALALLADIATYVGNGESGRRQYAS